MNVRLLDLKFCAVFRELLMPLCNELIREFDFEFRGLCKKGSRSKWWSSLIPWSAPARLLRFCVRIWSEAWIYVCCECCVFSGSALCVELITLPGECYRLWCVVVCDLRALEI